MGMVLISNRADRDTGPLGAKATHIRDIIADLTDAEAKEYLLQLIERDLAETGDALGRVKDAVPDADRQGVQVLRILWNARPRIKTYGYIGRELEYLNGKYPDELALHSAVKRLRRALESTDFPIEILCHYCIGYNIQAPADWRAPWDDD